MDTYTVIIYIVLENLLRTYCSITLLTFDLLEKCFLYPQMTQQDILFVRIISKTKLSPKLFVLNMCIKHSRLIPKCMYK